jgi:hypothetical protein
VICHASLPAVLTFSLTFLARDSSVRFENTLIVDSDS